MSSVGGLRKDGYLQDFTQSRTSTAGNASQIWDGNMYVHTHARSTHTHTHTHTHINCACANKSKALCGMVSYVQEHDHNVVYMYVAGGTGIR